MLNQRTPVAEIVLDHSETAGVFQRHRIDYCCKGELPLEEACRQRGADLKVVLAELESTIAERKVPTRIDPRNMPSEALVAYIVGRHHKYLQEAFPFLVPLAAKVARVHGPHDPSLLDVRDAVEELSDLLLPHLEYEEKNVFPRLRGEEAKSDPELQQALADIRNEHLEVATLLEWLRDATGDYALPEWACTSYRTLFRELEALEGDLFQHVHLEGHVLVPRFAGPPPAGS